MLKNGRRGVDSLLRLGFNSSKQYYFVLLSESAKSKNFPGTVVEPVGHLIQISLAEAFHQSSLQEILAQ